MSTGLTGVFARLTAAEPSTVLLTAALLSRDIYQPIAVRIFGSNFLAHGEEQAGLGKSAAL